MDVLKPGASLEAPREPGDIVVSERPAVELPPFPEPAPEKTTAPATEQTAEGILSRFTPLKFRKKVDLSTVLPQTKDELTKKVEAVMSQGMENIYKGLPPTKQVEFRMKGEETARTVRQMLRRTKISLRKLFLLLLAWLKIVPGVNTYYLEQEAKIKAEKILELRAEQEQKVI